MKWLQVKNKNESDYLLCLFLSKNYKNEYILRKKYIYANSLKNKLQNIIIIIIIITYKNILWIY